MTLVAAFRSNSIRGNMDIYVISLLLNEQLPRIEIFLSEQHIQYINTHLYLSTMPRFEVFRSAQQIQYCYNTTTFLITTISHTTTGLSKTFVVGSYTILTYKTLICHNDACYPISVRGPFSEFQARTKPDPQLLHQNPQNVQRLLLNNPSTVEEFLKNKSPGRPRKPE